MKQGDKTKQAALDAGIRLWVAHGREAVTARRVGKAVGLTHGGILYHFGSADRLVAAVSREAVRVKCEPIIGQLIVTNDAAVKDMPRHIKADYWRSFI